MDLFSVKQQVYVPTGSGRRKSICVRLRDTGQDELGPGPCTKSLPCGVPNEVIFPHVKCSAFGDYNSLNIILLEII